MIAPIRFFEQEIGVLHPHAGSSGPLAETVEVFGKEIELVLPLVEHLPIEIPILRTIAVGLIRGTGSKARTAPILDIISLDSVCPVSVPDMGMDVGNRFR